MTRRRYRADRRASRGFFTGSLDVAAATGRRRAFPHMHCAGREASRSGQLDPPIAPLLEAVPFFQLTAPCQSGRPPLCRPYLALRRFQLKAPCQGFWPRTSAYSCFPDRVDRGGHLPGTAPLTWQARRAPSRHRDGAASVFFFSDLRPTRALRCASLPTLPPRVPSPGRRRGVVQIPEWRRARLLDEPALSLASRRMARPPRPPVLPPGAAPPFLTRSSCERTTEPHCTG